MKKLSVILISVLLICMTCVFAAADHAHIYDDTDLISTENESKCERICEEIEQNYGYCVVFCLVNGIEDYTYVDDYCVTVCNSRISAENAIVYAHDMVTNTCGYYILGDEDGVFTDEVMDSLFDVYNQEPTFAAGVQAFLLAVSAELSADGASVIVPTQTTDDLQLQSATSAYETEDLFDLSVQDDLSFVVDNADLLTPAQELQLEEKLSALSSENNVDIVVLTVLSLNGKSSLSYADDYFDYNGYGQGEDRSGMLLLYKPGAEGDRDIALSTRGSLYDCVSDSDSDDMIDTLIPYLIVEDYETAFDLFASFAQQEISEIGKIKVLPFHYIFICLAIGFGAAFLIMKIRTASLKSVRSERTARYYIQPGSLVLTASRDNFLYKNVTKVAKQSQSSSGTSGRVSSSGARHGGTSRKF